MSKTLLLLLALHHATQALPFPVRYVQTDNGLEFQKRFHAKCEEVGLEHFYIHKSSPNDNAVIERSFRNANSKGGHDLYLNS